MVNFGRAFFYYRKYFLHVVNSYQWVDTQLSPQNRASCLANTLVTLEIGPRILQMLNDYVYVHIFICSGSPSGTGLYIITTSIAKSNSLSTGLQTHDVVSLNVQDNLWQFINIWTKQKDKNDKAACHFISSSITDLCSILVLGQWSMSNGGLLTL